MYVDIRSRGFIAVYIVCGPSPLPLLCMTPGICVCTACRTCARADVDRWQTMYVRYKCQPEAQVTPTGWGLSMSQRYADQLALEEQQPYLCEESLLYNGLAPISVALRIVEAPSEFAVPVKQDRCPRAPHPACLPACLRA